MNSKKNVIKKMLAFVKSNVYLLNLILKFCHQLLLHQSFRPSECMLAAIQKLHKAGQFSLVHIHHWPKRASLPADARKVGGRE